MPTFRTATVTSHTVLAAKFHQLSVKPSEPFSYEPGQYVSIRVTPLRINSYSIAAAGDNGQFILLIDTAPGGPGSQYFDQLKVNDTIEFLGPLGKFTLKTSDGSQNLLFLATGSGISPLRCMVDSALKDKNLTIPISLYFGLRHQEDIFWHDYFVALSRTHPNFSFKLCLSQPAAGWPGLTGHITDCLRTDLKSAQSASAYLCGNGSMINQSTEILTSLGCPPERIYTEKFF